jgi:hypothetical protein
MPAPTTDLAGAAPEQRIADYLEPWTEPRVRRSWLVMAAAAESRYTRDLVPALRRSTTPTLLSWGANGRFEKVEYAGETRKPRSSISRKRVTPYRERPGKVANALVDFFTA